MKDINLLSQSHQQKRERQNSGMGQKLGIAILVVLTLGGLGYGILAFLQARLASEERAIEQKIKEATPIVELKKDIQVKQEKINQLSEMVDLVMAQSMINTRIFEGISRVMPENVFIVNYALSQSADLSIIGKAKDRDSIAYFIHELKDSGMFSDVYLSNVSVTASKTAETDPSDITEYNFSALLTLKSEENP